MCFDHMSAGRVCPRSMANHHEPHEESGECCTSHPLCRPSAAQLAARWLVLFFGYRCVTFGPSRLLNGTLLQSIARVLRFARVWQRMCQATQDTGFTLPRRELNFRTKPKITAASCTDRRHGGTICWVRTFVCLAGFWEKGPVTVAARP